MSNPLPITFQDKENSPELLAYLAQFGPALYLDANEINQIKASLNWLYNNVGGGSGVTNNTGFIPGEEEYFFNTGFGWKLNGVYYAISEALSVPVPYAAAGMHRIDLIVANSTTIIRIPGPEVPVSESPAEPIYNQLTQLRITAIPVNEDGFGENTPVESINQFVKKTEYSENVIEGSGEITLEFTNERTVYRLISGTIEKVKGFDAETEFMSTLFYIRKEVSLINDSGRDIILNHDDVDTAWPFRFPKGEDFVWKNKHTVVFRPTKTDAQYLEFQSDSIVDDSRQQIEIDSNATVSNSWHGRVILFTASCTITVPSSLIKDFAFEWITLAGVTVTWAITSPKTWLFGSPAATPEKKTGAFMQRGATNSVILMT